MSLLPNNKVLESLNHTSVVTYLLRLISYDLFNFVDCSFHIKRLLGFVIVLPI